MYKNYGITREQYDILLESQNYNCKICGSSDSGRDYDEKTLLVDHCHETGQIRGLLCHPCNVSLGLMRDDPERLNKAAEYIRAFEE